jgi:hypothetical protein
MPEWLGISCDLSCVRMIFAKHEGPAAGAAVPALRSLAMRDSRIMLSQAGRQATAVERSVLPALANRALSLVPAPLNRMISGACAWRYAMWSALVRGHFGPRSGAEPRATASHPLLRETWAREIGRVRGHRQCAGAGRQPVARHAPGRVAASLFPRRRASPSLCAPLPGSCFAACCWQEPRLFVAMGSHVP